VLQVIISVVKRNFGNVRMAHLTLKLMQIMEALGRTVGQPDRQEE
jgi:RNase P/RNase MRP subunit POP5